MADQIQRLTVQVQGTAEYQKLATAADQARKAMAALEAQQKSLLAAQAQIRAPGAALTPAVLRTAIGGGNADPVKLDEQMAAAAARSAAQVTQAKKVVGDAEKGLNDHIKAQNDLLAANIRMTKDSADTTARLEASQARANITLQKAKDLNQQLDAFMAGPSPANTPGTRANYLSSLGAGAGRMGGRFGAFAGSAAQGLAYSLGESTGIPFAGPTAAAGVGLLGQAAGSGLSSLSGAGTIGGLAAGGVAGAAVIGAVGFAGHLAKDTADAIERSMDYRLGAATVVPDFVTPRAITEGVLGAGSQFNVGFDQNTQNARMLAQMGVGGMGRNGVDARGLPRALQLGYAVAQQAGMDPAQGVQLIGTMMTRQGMNVDQAARAWQNYANAASAAHVPLQRLADMLQTMEQANLPLGANIGQMASMQAQLGLGVNPVQLLSPAMGATGFGAKTMEAMLGLTSAQFHQMQTRNPAALFDRIAQTAKGAAGGDQDVLAGLLNIFGMDTSGMSSEQVNNLAGMIQGGKPGAAQAYYNQFVKAGANRGTGSTGAFISQQAKNRAGAITPLDTATTQAPYLALQAMEHPATVAASALDELGRAAQTGADLLNSLDTALGHFIPDASAAGTGSSRSADQSKQGAPPGFVNPGGQVPADYGAGLPPKIRKSLGAYVAASLATGVHVDALIAQDIVESSMNPNAQNAGHMGLGQLSPAIWATYGTKGGNPYDPAQNIMAQAKYDQYLLGNLHGKYEAMFAAYNEGLGGYQAKGAAGTEPGYMDKLGGALQSLVTMGIHVDVTVHDSSGRTLPSTSTIRPGPTTAPTHSPGQSRGHR